MFILGVDPGLAITGYGLVDHQGHRFIPITYGSIRTASGQPLHLRLHQLFNGLKKIIDEYQPHCLVVEELFFNRNVSTAMMVGQARGVILLTGAMAGLDIYEYTPLQVKQAVVGYGRAEKEQIQYMIRVILNLAEVPSPDDVADALAVAVCHGQNSSGLGALR